MAHDDCASTSHSLLARLRHHPTDQAAWDAFVVRYGPGILSWCRQWRLQDADAEDVTQDVLARLAHALRRFSYDPNRSFRGWLRTLTHHAISDFLSQRRIDRGSGDTGVLEMLGTVAAREDLLARLEDAFDHELLSEAMDRVRLRVEPHNWQAFLQTAVHGESGKETAAKLGIQITAVYKAKSRVQQLVRDEIQQLEREIATGDGQTKP